VVNLSSAREILGTGDEIHLLAGSFRNAKSYYDARNLHTSVLRLKDTGERLAAQLGMEYEVRLPKADAITGFQNFAGPLRAFFGVFTLLALTIAGLLIYSNLDISGGKGSVSAILRTLGAKSRDIFKFVLGESVILCFMGVVPGHCSEFCWLSYPRFALARAEGGHADRLGDWCGAHLDHCWFGIGCGPWECAGAGSVCHALADCRALEPLAGVALLHLRS
jgi:hypothetical protein